MNSDPTLFSKEQQAEADALLMRDRLLKKQRDFTQADLFDIHTVVMRNTVDMFEPSGEWKLEDNSAWGNENYATAEDTPALMKKWLAEFNKRREGKGDSFADHVWLHATFLRIHPFAEGNGRMARLLANVPLLNSGCKVVDIPTAARARYLTALARWQIACGVPCPNAQLCIKPDILKDFSALCKESQGKPTPKPKTTRRRR